MNCKGPCLFHCYKKNSLILLLIGVLIGLCLNKNNIEKFFLKNANIESCESISDKEKCNSSEDCIYSSEFNSCYSLDCGIANGNELKCNNKIGCIWCPSEDKCYSKSNFPCDECGTKDNCPLSANCKWCKNENTCLNFTKYYLNANCEQDNN